MGCNLYLLYQKAVLKEWQLLNASFQVVISQLAGKYF